MGHITGQKGPLVVTLNVGVKDRSHQKGL